MLRSGKLNIDRKKHISYSRRAEKKLRERLAERYGREEQQAIWNKAVSVYESYLTDLPYIGGKKNPMASQLYDSLICFAYWEALPVKESVGEFKLTVDRVFFGQDIKTFPRWFSVQNQKLLDIAAFLVGAFAEYTMNRHVRSGEWNNAWKLLVNPKKRPKEGLRAVLVGCPIYDFAKAHDLLFLMPAMCNGDYGSMPHLRADTIRPKTVSRGYRCCDNYIVNNESAVYDKYPVKRDKNGFLYNDEPADLK
ncbi:L-2-amino-thiazoline-4-carboxylic acid hydrolase [Ruminococcus sp. YE71]|uniref:L-2-amino-thiazoline-4-carboxylic acid hydrolase n=1 Tax=unclassified Ruminococcus TaxID=2608920 RepID=UPI0008870ED4|nr:MULTISPECIES: L-2-amino-thiazoline-4-carboxylic acid hydrolase [unclassified Ruminococcus]SDA28119.1 L-2-amino-thiazoline-4-carboxylic acid hydrolase [Ruminococcus sp. YE78]SFW35355.1 L-2-amino-thiazoline-4-carboxylic acid hydrolase [Ruminococcus sp. YE71]